MNASDRPVCKELFVEDITPQVADDIRDLLKQLTSNDALIAPDENDIIDMLWSGTRLFVAATDERVVGTALLCQIKGLVGTQDRIEDVVVDSEYRGRGIANELMDLLEEESWKRGIDKIYLTSNKARTAARAMYVKRGYVEYDSTSVFCKAIT